MRKTFILLLLQAITYFTLSAQNVSRVENSPFPATLKPDTLFYTGKTMTDSEVFATGSLSGILARTKPMIMQWQYFHQEIVREANLGIKIIDTYNNDFQGLLNFFSKRLDGYILCDPKAASSNVAASLSGILNAVAIPTDIENKAILAGLTKVLDVTGKDENWLLNNYADKLNKNFAFFQHIDSWVGLVDYAAYTGGIRYYDPNINGILATKVYNFLNPGATYFGWWVSEDGTVAKLSEKSFKILPSGGLKNLATFTNVDVPIVKQKEPVTPYQVVPNVHTVCFVITDGDHIGWVAGAGYWDSWIWKNDNQSRLKLGFTLSPALAELTPVIYNDIINGLQTTPEGRNVAIASPSGVGYYFPSLSPNQSYHAEQLNKFMRKADMSIVNVIDADNGAHDPTEYLKQNNIDALFYYSYGAQYTGLKGKVSWYKGKPSIGGRFSFWGNSSDRSPETQELVAQSMANVINAQSTNINAEAGYSLIPVHIWTENPHDVLNLCSKLGPNVRVVAPDEFVWLIKKNLGKLPMGNGTGLNGEYYKGSQFDSLVYNRIDKKIDFDWGTSAPVISTGKDNFSIKWSGQIQPLFAEEYAFHLTSNAGVRLVVNGITLIDSLQSSNSGVRSGKIALIAGEKYDIIIEYRKETGSANCLLEWESLTQVRQIIPFTQLYANPISTTGLVTVYNDKNKTGFSAGLKIGNYTSDKLAELGIHEGNVSSLSVKEGFKAILYNADNFTGDSLVLVAGADSLNTVPLGTTGQNWDNKAMSVRIKANGVTDMSGAYYLKNFKSKFFLEVAGGVNATDYNTNVQQNNQTRTNNQAFQFIHLGDGVYEIMARHSKMVLTVAKMGFNENANVHQWKYHDSESQKFILVPSTLNKNLFPDTYKMISVYSGMVINASNLSVGGNVQMNTNTNQFNGIWTMTETTNREGTGDGLKGDYFAGKTMSVLKYSRTDPQVNFNWGEGSPGSPMVSDNFSVRWTGFIQPRYSGTYTFYINSDNGRRLWIDDKLIIDKWISDWGVVYSGTVELTEMKKHKIKVEYFEEVGGANISLQWSSDLETKEIVPQSQLYSGTTPNALPDPEMYGISVYPNPASNVLYVKGLDYPVPMQVYNSLGAKVAECEGSSCNIEHLPAGLYFISLKIDGNSIALKFLKTDSK